MSYTSSVHPFYDQLEGGPAVRHPSAFGAPRHASLSGAYVPSQSTSHATGTVPLYSPYPGSHQSHFAASIGSTPAVNPSLQAYHPVPVYNPSTQPRTFNNTAYADIYPSVAAMPPLPTSQGYSSGSNYVPRSLPNTISICDSDEESPSPTLPPVLLSDPSPSPTTTDSLVSSSSHRRHPFHPEGTPQPKGRGARKTTKPTDDASKTLPCDGCDALFARKHDLDRHRRIHTLEAPYLCRGCMRSYRRSDARKRHWDQEPACNQMHIRKTSEKPYPA